jgi:hypothetical protein
LQKQPSAAALRPRTSFGRKRPVFSAKYKRMAPDSNTLIGSPPSDGTVSMIAGMRLFGEMARKSGLN